MNPPYTTCDTIFYQGANSTQTQVMHYSGSQIIRATTGEFLCCHGRNNLKPLNVIFNLHIGEEIADVNLTPYAAYYDYLNPFKWLYTAVSWTKNYATGVHIHPAKNPLPESVIFHSPNLANMSYGQRSDIESHQRKYLSWKENKKNDGLILYGVSRGTAATFNAYATYQYPEVKLVILEGAIDSMENILKSLARRLLRYESVANLTYEGLQTTVAFLNRNGLFGYKREGESPLSLVDQFPENTPVVFITSKKDTIVPPENTKNIATVLNQRGKNDVYVLELNNSRHPCYMYDDKQDREQYETFIHAIYKKYGIAHDAECAQKGEPLVEQCLLIKPTIVCNYNSTLGV